MGKAKQVALLGFVFVGTFAFADLSPLLPRPQELRYKAGSMPVRGMTIVFSSSPSAADRFAAVQLAAVFEERTGLRVPVQDYGENPGFGPVILLDRVAAMDHPIAVPGDLPGPKSSEAYDLTVPARGVKIHRRSSAGMFYGIQALTQPIEASGYDALRLQVIHEEIFLSGEDRSEERKPACDFIVSEDRGLS